MSVKRIVTVPSGAAAGRKLGRSDPTLDATSLTDVGASRPCTVAVLPPVARDRRELAPVIRGAPCAARPIPHPRMGQMGQKYPAPLAAQIPIRKTLTSR